MEHNGITQLLNNFSKIIFHILEVRTPHTMEHVERVPVLANMIAKAVDKYTPTTFSKDDFYQIDMAAKLHDCGKITTYDYLLEKSTKTEFPRNRIHEIRNRFEILYRDAEISSLKKMIKHPEQTSKIKKELKKKLEQLKKDFEFIAECNLGNMAMTQKEITKLSSLSKKHFKRHFSRLAGLSFFEISQLSKEQKLSYNKEATETILQDNPEDYYKDIPTGEFYNLCTFKGTINAQERAKIEQHAQETENILKMLQLPREFQKIITYASEHHEQPSGKGYPKGLKEKQLSVPSKILTIADIFEALTSSGRPYKSPKKLSESLKILKIMKDKQQIDAEIYHLCLQKGIFTQYAKKHLSPEQIDITDTKDFY